jgi:hypothetical protein
MKPVKLEVYHLPDGGKELEEMGVNVSLDDCSIHKVLFFRIDAIGPSSYRKSSIIYSAGMTFVCPMTMIALENKLYNEFGCDKIDNE